VDDATGHVVVHEHAFQGCEARSRRRRMRNPWLDIPLADYEGHMALPHVGQAQLLSDIFAAALHKHSPRSVAILGCAGGNGLDRVDLKTTERIVCLDINSEYIEQVRARFGHRMPMLEAIVGDLQADNLSFPAVELIFAGLVFEYVDVDGVLAKIRPRLSENGVLVTVVQLASSSIPKVTPSPFASLNKLSSTMRLVNPEYLRRLAAMRGYQEIKSRDSQAPGDRQFQVQAFERKGTFETDHESKF
jgi:SAM-dependent methyltransferase